MIREGNSLIEPQSVLKSFRGASVVGSERWNALFLFYSSGAQKH